MTSKRQRRVAVQIQEVLSELVQFEVEDPRLAGVTIMEVSVDRELMYATVYVSTLGGVETREEVMPALQRAAGFLRYELGRRIRLQNTPELRFNWDETLEQADRIENLLNSLKASQDTSGGEADAE